MMQIHTIVNQLAAIKPREYACMQGYMLSRHYTNQQLLQCARSDLTEQSYPPRGVLDVTAD